MQGATFQYYYYYSCVHDFRLADVIKKSDHYKMIILLSFVISIFLELQ